MERIKMNALKLCILTFVVVCNFLFSVGINWTRYNYESYFDGYRCVPNETIFQKFNVYNSGTCGRICHVTNKCVSYLYQPDKHLCIGCRVYGAIWTGHYDELPGSVYMAKECDQDYKMVCHYKSMFRINSKYEFGNIDAQLCTHIIYEIEDFTDIPWRVSVRHRENEIKQLEQLKDTNPCLKTFVRVDATPAYTEIGAVLYFLRTSSFNGIDIDMRPPISLYYQENLAGIVEEIKQAFDLYGYRLTAVVSARENELDFKPIVEYVRCWRKGLVQNAGMTSKKARNIEGKYWISYDSFRSISEKLYWLKEKGYGGACLFQLHGDDSKQVCKSSSQPFPLLSVINDILTSG